MATVPLPEKIVGEFFVLEYRRDVKNFIIHIDDSDGSSFDLGDDIPSVMAYFKSVGLQDLGNRAIDFSKEFGAAQAVIANSRVVALFDRAPCAPVLNFQDDELKIVLAPMDYARLARSRKRKASE